MDQSGAYGEFEFLECPICYKRMNNIAFLCTEVDDTGQACPHAFCYDCITETLRFNELNGKLLKACPVCRRHITMVGRNVVADQLSVLLEKFWRESKQQGEDLVALQRELVEARKQAARAGEVDVLQRELEALRDSARMLGENLELETSKTEELFARLDQEHGQLEEALNQNKLLEEERVRLTKKIVSIREEAEELRGNLEARTAENERLRTQLEEAEKRQAETTSSAREEKQRAQEELEQERQKLRDELRKAKADQEREMSEQRSALQFELAKVKSEHKRTAEGLNASSEELARMKAQLEDARRKAASLESTLTEQTQRFDRERKKYEQQQRLLENRIGEMETKLQVADRELKVFSDMYESTKSTLKEKELQLHTLRRNATARRPQNEAPIASEGSLIGMVANTAISSISKGWWGAQTSTSQGQGQDYLPIHLYSDYIIIERRGSSKTSSVWKARELTTKRHVALKRKAIPSAMIQQTTSSSSSSYYMNLLSSATGALVTSGTPSMTVEDQITVFREAMILSRFTHPNIVKVHAIIQQPKEIYLVMEFVEYDLEYWYSQNRNVDEQIIKSIFFQLLQALYYIHTAECVHRKLMPPAILLTDAGNVKLTGFGSAFSLFSQPTVATGNSSHQLSSTLGYLRYCAPELIYHPQIFVEDWSYWKETDVWSAGCILAEVFLRKPLFGSVGTGGYHSSSSFDNSRDDTVLLRAAYRIVDCRPTTPGFLDRYPILKSADAFYHNMEGNKLEQASLGQLVANASPQALDLMRKMLQVEYQKRIDVLSALHHPWFHDLPGYSAPKLSCHLSNELTDSDIPAFVSRTLQHSGH